ncbi:MAG TPA: FAD-dependent oxidoreductase [Dehalococcoidia bacterium]|nr:FAD-dependent oxidoreductase [Dehalococcoidia bacterium]
MQQGNGRTISEPERLVPVYGQSQVLVVGGGPAGFAAAVAAAREGADVVLVERYGCLGGLSTGGLVIWIDRMTDWDGHLVVGGIAQELMDRCREQDAIIGPPKEQWGSRDPKLAGYWGVRTTAQRGIVNWAPTIDPEVLKLISNDMVREAGVQVLFHCWAVATIHKDSTVKGVIFESKQGRFALLADVVVDCTGDGDIFAGAGAEFENDFDPQLSHARLNTAFRFGNVDMRRYLDFRMMYPEKYRELTSQANEQDRWLSNTAYVTPYDSVALFVTPKFTGYSALSIKDLSEVEFRSRDSARTILAWFRANMPGFERAWLLDTASQIGTRHSRRLRGVTKVKADVWRASGGSEQSIGLCPGLSPEFPTLEIPYGCLVPNELEGLIVAGRNLSSDPAAHAALREIPECWVMGQGAGVAAAIAARDRRPLRGVKIAELQGRLRAQEAIVARSDVDAKSQDMQAASAR